MPTDVSAVGTAAQTASQKASSAANLNFDTFLSLLTTQIQNQDPLDPMDGTAFTEQIATFTALEQQIATNSYLEKLVDSESFGAQALAVSYIGKEALVPKDRSDLANGEMNFSYTMEKRAIFNEIRIVDSSGATVKVMEGALDEGTHEVSWDGISDTGQLAADGTYRIFIETAGADGNVVPVEIFSFDKIKAMETDGDKIKLITESDDSVNFNSVLQVREAKKVEANI